MVLSRFKLKRGLAASQEQCMPEHAGVARSQKGFSLAETLLALAILVLLTGIVAMGVPTAFRTYTQLVNKSESQVLLSTATAELRNELGHSQYVLTDNGLNKAGTVLYYVSPDGYWANIENRTLPSGRTDIVRKLYMSDVFMSDEAMRSAETNKDFIPVTVKNGENEVQVVESLAATQVTNELSMEIGDENNDGKVDIALDANGYFIVDGLKVKDAANNTLAKVGGSADSNEYYIQALMLKAS